jgi:hypothetical protein
MDSQRRFAVMGTNLFKILNRLSHSQELCRLLKYQSRDPFAVTEKQPDLEGYDLLGK